MKITSEERADCKALNEGEKPENRMCSGACPFFGTCWPNAKNEHVSSRDINTFRCCMYALDFHEKGGKVLDETGKALDGKEIIAYFSESVLEFYKSVA